MPEKVRGVCAVVVNVSEVHVQVQHMVLGVCVLLIY